MKLLARIECDKVRVYRMKKGPRQMVTVASRLYRIDDNLMLKDTKTDEAMIIYDIDETQPWGVRPQLVNPDMTRALIDSAKLAGNKAKVWAVLDGSKIMNYLTAAIVAGALLYGVLIV